MATTVLAPEEAARREGESATVRRRRVVARAALRIALGRYLDRPPASLELRRGLQGKPELVGAASEAPIHFNLARSEDLCLIAIATGGPVGIDVEAIRPFPELERLVAARFEPEEAAGVLGLTGPARLRAFYRCWTRKEASLKASGIGLAAGLGARPDPDLALVDLDLPEGFAGALAGGGAALAESARSTPYSLPLDR